MHDNNQGRVDVVWKALEKHLQGVDATGGRPDANCWKALPGRLVARSFLVSGRPEPMIVIAHLRPKTLCNEAALRGRYNSSWPREVALACSCAP